MLHFVPTNTRIFSLMRPYVKQVQTYIILKKNNPGIEFFCVVQRASKTPVLMHDLNNCFELFT